jgi:uncharacterized membrane protein SirB2
MFLTLKFVHLSCAVLTLSGFILRAYWMLYDSPLLQARLTRVLPHIIDTVFLLSGIAMLVVLSINPFQHSWLVAKFGGLLLYIFCGTLALKRGPTRRSRIVAAIMALAVFGYIVGAAYSRSALSWLAL